jgi:hypothetical protein
MVRYPIACIFGAVFGPMPHIRSMGSGARNAATSPSATTTSPSGLRRSLATFAANLHGATPADAVSSSSARTSRLIAPAIDVPSPKSATLPVTSRNASSSDSGSTSGVYRRKIANTCSLAAS